MAEEYELVPEKEVEDLKREVDEIKKNPLGASSSGRELVRAMKDLTDSVNHLIGLFRDAADAMKLEEKESEAIGKKLAPMLDKMNMLIDQNEKIARGIVGVADMVKDDMSKKPESRPGFRPSYQQSAPDDFPAQPPRTLNSGGSMPEFQIQPPTQIRSPMGMPPGGIAPPAAPKEMQPKRRIFGF